MCPRVAQGPRQPIETLEKHLLNHLCWEYDRFCEITLNLEENYPIGEQFFQLGELSLIMQTATPRNSYHELT